ncbi:hypothetical protein MesoLjLc_76150 [Mesorhizobium sp. L-8-10]|uniref:tripartite tricarboxylate transporter TctB family protein n=2 Tax=unclassified Mesorhizobium TaxID=325217 RepID=UPI00193555B7|nr:tripartite tricarboxylate transporter TctB family protein [Mesorhizobium sp. L-8-10]BCH27738.1 hypothetical protein MesoLjLb_75230 [Mesorhizobium sp. L-8-3]BCH35685.1 hypothetical protein MesoLjLc_76150 [Mesorhizobium sp. L-8-10]
MGKISTGAAPRFLGGTLLLVIGAGFAAGALRYEVGGVTTMGPGFAPLVLGSLLAVLGLVEIIQSTRSTSAEIGASIEWAATFCVLSAVLAFAVLIGTIGFDPAVFAAVMISMLWDRPIRLMRSLVLTASVTLFADIVFLRLLALPYRAFGS